MYMQFVYVTGTWLGHEASMVRAAKRILPYGYRPLFRAEGRCIEHRVLPLDITVRTGRTGRNSYYVPVHYLVGIPTLALKSVLPEAQRWSFCLMTRVPQPQHPVCHSESDHPLHEATRTHDDHLDWPNFAESF